MKFIKSRDRIDKAILAAAIGLAIIPVIGLLTGTAFSPGYMGSNYQEYSLHENPGQYWFLIKIELAVVLFIAFRAKFTFPLFHSAYLRVLNFKDNNKVLAYFLFYLVVPIIVVCVCLFLMHVFLQ